MGDIALYRMTWHDYSAYEAKADDIFGNLWRGRLFAYRRYVALLGLPVDCQEWCMTPQTVNAVNLPLHNALDLPAAILPPPFFDWQAFAALNCAAIGSIIGHEIICTFASRGSTFDSNKHGRDWWKTADLDHFNFRRSFAWAKPSDLPA